MWVYFRTSQKLKNYIISTQFWCWVHFRPRDSVRLTSPSLSMRQLPNTRNIHNPLSHTSIHRTRLSCMHIYTYEIIYLCKKIPCKIKNVMSRWNGCGECKFVREVYIYVYAYIYKYTHEWFKNSTLWLWFMNMMFTTKYVFKAMRAWREYVPLT